MLNQKSVFTLLVIALFGVSACTSSPKRVSKTPEDQTAAAEETASAEEQAGMTEYPGTENSDLAQTGEMSEGELSGEEALEGEAPLESDSAGIEGENVEMEGEDTGMHEGAGMSGDMGMHHDNSAALDTESSGEMAGKAGESTAKLGTKKNERDSMKMQRTVETEIPVIMTERVLADVNRMNAEQFRAIGFTQEAANKIIEKRTEKGQFKNVDEIANISGVDRATFDSLRDKLGTQPTG